MFFSFFTRLLSSTPTEPTPAFNTVMSILLLGLLHEDEQYDALTSLQGLFGKSYFCPHCLKAYDHLGEHACSNNKANHYGACLQEGCNDHAEAYKRYRSADLECPQ